MANKKLESNENKKKLPGMKGYEKKDRKKMLAGFKSKRKDPGGKSYSHVTLMHIYVL